jgi:hypothetical protein
MLPKLGVFSEIVEKGIVLKAIVLESWQILYPFCTPK